MHAKLAVCWGIVVLALTIGSANGASINFGVAGPLTGPNAVFGEQFRNGAGQAIEDINATGGVANQSIRVFYGDDAADPAKGVAVAQQFSAEGVSYVVGHFNSDVTLRASVVYEENNILEITPASTNPDVTDRGMWNIFRTCGRDDRIGPIASKYINQHFDNRRVAIIQINTKYGDGLASSFEEALKASGTQPLMHEVIEVGQVNFDDVLNKLKSNNVNIVFYAGEHPEAAILVREMPQRGIDAVMIGGDGISTEDFVLAGGEHAEGTIVIFSMDPRTRMETAEVTRRFLAKRIKPEFFTFYSYAAVQVIKQAIEAAHSTDPKSVAALISSGQTFRTVIGNIHYAKNGDVENLDYFSYMWKKNELGRLSLVEVK
jgi:branched-chain amino acid transport system substrate-binding protein